MIVSGFYWTLGQQKKSLGVEISSRNEAKREQMIQEKLPQVEQRWTMAKEARQEVEQQTVCRGSRRPRPLMSPRRNKSRGALSEDTSTGAFHPEPDLLLPKWKSFHLKWLHENIWLVINVPSVSASQTVLSVLKPF